MNTLAPLKSRNNSKKSKFFSKFFASLITIIVVSLLVFSGPAQAFSVSLGNFDDSTPTQGDTITATATIDIRGDERMAMPNPLGVFVDNNLLCTFSFSDTEVVCGNVTVRLVASSSNASLGYGYGYKYGYDESYGYYNGYTNGIYTYDIIINTTDYSAGIHSVEIRVNVKEDPFVKTYNSLERTFDVQQVEEEQEEEEDNSNSGGGCLTTWVCGDWGSCINGFRTRACEKVNPFCYAFDQEPFTTMPCSGSEEEGTEILETTENNLGINAITGAVIGALSSGAAIPIAIFVAILLLLVAIISILRRRMRVAI